MTAGVLNLLAAVKCWSGACLCQDQMHTGCNLGNMSVKPTQQIEIDSKASITELLWSIGGLI